MAFNPFEIICQNANLPQMGGDENKKYLSCHHAGNDDADDDNDGGRRQELVFLCSSTSGNHCDHFTRFQFAVPIATLSHSSVHNATTRHKRPQQISNNHQ